MPTFGLKTNERPGTRASVRHVRMSAYKAREVLDLIRGREVQQADEILEFSERDAAITVRKLLHSAMANAETNDAIDPEELFVSACYADEGPTLKRWRPRARGRATRIRKRTCHITIIVTRLSEEDLERRRTREAQSTAAAGRGRRRHQAASDARRQRVAKSRAREEAKADEEAEEHDHEHDHDDEIVEAADTESSAATEDAADTEPAEGADVVEADDVVETDDVEPDADAVVAEAEEAEAEEEAESTDTEEEEE
jgi:large subunit ribosomal protein L22